jgi:hypothetical protein
MARSVRVGDFQRMQRNAGKSGPRPAETVATVEAAEPTNGHDETAPPSTLTVPQQLAALDLHVSAHPPYDEVVKRLRVRASLLDIPALDEEIAAEARRRCNMLPEPPADPEDRAAQTLAEKHARGLHDGLTIGGCPACDPVEPKPEDQAESDSLESAVETATVSDGQPTMADELISLNVESICTAEMSLHMITERVRDAVQAAGELLPSDPSDAEIVAEAERIWVSLDRKRSHTYSVDADGTVRDWRRPDTTPDRGDVTKEHTITDDEPRFSGAGGGQVRQVSTLIPADKDFNGKPYLESTELAALASDLIEKHGYLEHLENCEIRYFWKRKTGSSGRQRVLGGIKRGSDLLGHLLKADFAIFLAADTARDSRHADRRVERSLFRQLRRLGQDDKGNFILLPWSLQLFPEEIQEYADLDDADLKLGRNAYRGAEQMGLFREDVEPAEDDDGEGEAAEQAYFDAAGDEMERARASDGAGVLIHDDGTPLSADEIAEMEAAELADDDDPDEDDDVDEIIEQIDEEEGGDELQRDFTGREVALLGDDDPLTDHDL